MKLKVDDIIQLASVLIENKVKTNNLHMIYDVDDIDFKNLNQELANRFIGIKEENPSEIEVNVLGIKFIFRLKEQVKKDEPKIPKGGYWSPFRPFQK